MVHQVTIWSKDKETGKKIKIELHEEVTQKQVEELAMKNYADEYDLEDDRTFWAELNETTH